MNQSRNRQEDEESIQEKEATTTARRIADDADDDDDDDAYDNPPFQESKFDETYHRWKDTVGEETIQEEGITEEYMRQTCKIICTKFPRGDYCGALLHNPVVDDTPLERRGVSLQWLYKVMVYLRKLVGKQSPIISTRLFVALFIEPLVLRQRQGEKEDYHPTIHQNHHDNVLPLYFFVPPKFRGLPEVFISHGWESWLRHLFFFPRTSVPMKLAKRYGCDKGNTFVWLDIFAIVQDPGSTKQSEEVAKIGEVIRSIGKTCLIVPGHGSLHFALLPARRSWCCFEIAFTQQLSARVGLTKTYFEGSSSKKGKVNDNDDVVRHSEMDFHKALIRDIEQLDCKNAETRCNSEKEAIVKLLDSELGIDNANRIVRRAILQAFQERYSSKTKQPQQIISDQWKKSQNVSDLYQKAIESFREQGIL